MAHEVSADLAGVVEPFGLDLDPRAVEHEAASFHCVVIGVVVALSKKAEAFEERRLAIRELLDE